MSFLILYVVVIILILISVMTMILLLYLVMIITREDTMIGLGGPGPLPPFSVVLIIKMIIIQIMVIKAITT